LHLTDHQQTGGQVEEAVRAGATMVLLDNMTPEEVAACVALADPAGRGPGRRPVAVEVSGGVSLDTAPAYAAGQVQLMGVGASVAGNFVAKNPQVSTEFKLLLKDSPNYIGVAKGEDNAAWLVNSGTLYSVDLKTGKATSAGKIEGLSGTLTDIAWVD